MAALVIWLPVQRLFQTTSVEAIVNARTLTLRAPIDGVVSSAPASLAIGATFPAGTPLLHITNSRADRTRFDDLRRLEEHTEIEAAALKTRLDNIERMHSDFVAQTRLFQIGRIAQLEARIEESKSNLAASTTRQEETAAVLERALELDSKGFQPKALLEKVRRDDEIAKQDVRSIEQRIKGIAVELDSAKSGSFLGDSYNDRPRSSQRADELQQQVVELSAQLTEKQLMIRQLKKEIDVERDRLQLNSDAQVLAPSSSAVWELLTAPGEHVQRGQELMRLLDCNAALVTAVVSETVYNRLQIGSSASFRLRDGDVAMPGRVVNLTGVASATANYAIAPSSLRKEQYRVAVEVPDLANDGQGCHLGRTGQVIFANQSGAAITATAQ
ncbi:HlyD family efflux transporter periplasmic adaptor subunit [Bradyrhizobium sp.]|uniref:HlyD family efflux transporter periplasmic adaptor subunit n=1 Tax=Bradyrhizobium sp. TaxID=376 RepID=UPI003C711593